MPFVNIRYVRENITENADAKKAAMSAKVAEAIGEAMGMPASSVWIVFEEVAARDWFVGVESVETMRKKEK